MVKIMMYSSNKLKPYNESVTNVAIRVIKSASTNIWWPRTTTNKTAIFTIFVNVINTYIIYLFFIKEVLSLDNLKEKYQTCRTTCI